MINKLLTLDRKSVLRFDVNAELYATVYDKLSSIADVMIPEENRKLLELSDSLGSAEIEGAHTTLQSVFAGEDSKDNRMVVGALRALKYLNVTGTSEQTIKRANAIVLNEDSAGSYRSKMVHVGNDVKIVHTPASVQQVPEYMRSLFDFSIGNKILDAIVRHFYFVYVHPFVDGNGRTARAMTIAELTNKCLPLAKAISCKQSAYYQVIQSGERSNDISEFVQYMLLRLIDACEMYMLYTRELSESESVLLSRIDVTGRGEISLTKAATVVGANDAPTTLKGLQDKGFLSYSNGVYRLKWR